MDLFYGNVFKALNKARVKYVVAGGVAVVLHGYMRVTGDLDLIVLLEQKNLEKFYDTLAKIGYIPKRPVTKEQFSDAKMREQWKKDKGMIVFSFCHKKPPYQLIDMFVDEPIPFTEIYKQKTNVKAYGTAIPIIGIDHLVKLKRNAGRGKDLDDIVQLNAIKRIQQR